MTRSCLRSCSDWIVRHKCLQNKNWKFSLLPESNPLEAIPLERWKTKHHWLVEWNFYLLMISIFCSREVNWLFQASMWRWKVSQRWALAVRLPMLVATLFTGSERSVLFVHCYNFTFTVQGCQTALNLTPDIFCKLVQLICKHEKCETEARSGNGFRKSHFYLFLLLSVAAVHISWYCGCESYALPFYCVRHNFINDHKKEVWLI